MREKFFTAGTVIHLEQRPRDVVESPSLEVFKMRWDRVLDNLTQAPLPTKGWTRRSAEVPSSLGCSVIL